MKIVLKLHKPKNLIRLLSRDLNPGLMDEQRPDLIPEITAQNEYAYHKH